MHTRILDTLDTSHYRGYLNAAAEALNRGELVAFPTETVYGIGANAQNEEAVARLYAVKNRPREKEFARLISGREEISELSDEMPPYARVLAEKFWPGPLTIVFTGPDKRDIGVRLPRNRVAQDLVRLAGVPVVATSANLSGRPPATDASRVLEYFGGKIGIVLDGGTSELERPSTVVKVTRESCEILREGAISEERIMDCLGIKVEVNR
ncbi:MAG: threonylcarbamoyl-AMP synthase [Planctomycetes bacterium]|nr:threonylcarbamoyl-AMP synthase [Planctomycetota bacterium]